MIKCLSSFLVMIMRLSYLILIFKKKHITGALVFLCTFVSLSAHADGLLKLGIKGGVDANVFHFDKEVLDKSNQIGWFAGPTMKLSFPLEGLGFDASILYDYRLTRIDYALMRSRIKQEQLVFPVNVRYSIGLGELASVFIFAGPQIAFNIGGKDFQWDKENIYKLENSNLSVNIGFGVTAFKHLQVSANYNIVCGRTGSATLKTITDAVKPVKDEKDSRNNTWQLGLAYFF